MSQRVPARLSFENIFNHTFWWNSWRTSVWSYDDKGGSQKNSTFEVIKVQRDEEEIKFFRKKECNFIFDPCPFFHCSDCYSLSVLKRNSHSSMDCVKHYCISCLQNNWVYMSPGKTFPSLHHLVEHYSGLCAVKSLLKKTTKTFTLKQLCPSPRLCRWAVLSTHGAVLHQGSRRRQRDPARTHSEEEANRQLEGHQQVW